MRTIGVLTSGGDAPGMNPAIRAVVRTGIFHDLKILGIKEGYKGLIEGQLMEMDISSVADIIHRGGTMLRTSRSEEFRTPQGLEKACDVLKFFGIDGLIVLGGDGSIKGAHELAKRGIPVIGIPCTIDNDCGWSDYTIGFMTAVETVTEAISKIRDTSTSHGRANVIEVMGRKCGDIALHAGVAGGAESIIIPERPVDLDAVCEKALQGKLRGKRHHIIVVAEGSGEAYEVAEKISEVTGIDTRVTILGYIQRGGSPCSFDRIIASRMGSMAVASLVEGKYNRVMGISCNDVVNLPLEYALEQEKKIDLRLYEIAQKLSI